jgi:hypothetical protein
MTKTETEYEEGSLPFVAPASADVLPAGFYRERQSGACSL